MPYRIEVKFKKGMRDALGESVAKKIREDLGIPVHGVQTIDVYTIDADLNVQELKNLGEEVFVDKVIQEFFVDAPAARGEDFDYAIEVGFLPGVTDNVGRTAGEAVGDFLKEKGKGVGVYYSRQYLVKGINAREQAEKIARDLLANELIERWEAKERKEFGNGMEAYVPKVHLSHEPRTQEIDLNVNDGELMKISRERTLALNLEEMKAIQKYFADPEVVAERRGYGLGDKPVDVELEALAQTWSEHCKHKIFTAEIDYFDEEKGERKKINSLFNTFVRGTTEFVAEKCNKKHLLKSVFKDNAGVVEFNPEWNIVMKVETHNSPSALDPYGGALTGIVGVNRDPLGTGMGARLLFNTDVFCFATPFFEGKLPPRLLHPKRVFEGVRRGVEHGGNKSGIPTVNGCVVFHERFLGKPLVYCGTCGIMPARVNGAPSEDKQARAGDLVVMTGGRIGKDGIHGATFSSEELHEGSPATAVQIGDPITQKKMLDFLLEARDLGLYNSITDNGAGGLSCSVGEMAKESGGCEIELEHAPLKYAGLDPWEILLSEAQERMTLAVPKEKIEEFLALAKKREVEATVLGKFNSTKWFHVKFRGKTVAFLDMEFLHEGVPQMKLVAKWKKPLNEEPGFLESSDLTQELKKLLGRLNVCSKEYVVRQYDHEVQGGSALKPLVGAENDGPSDAGVVRPLLDSVEAIVVANGISPKYSDVDAYWMSACALDEAVRNNIAAGGNLETMALLDNFCWCDPVKSEKTPDGEYKLAQLVRANQALYDFATAYGTPLISGKDSMKNDYSIGGTRISIPPTILYTSISKISDARKIVSMDAKKAGDLVYLLGETRNELGGSEYFAEKGFVGNNAPKVDAEKALRLYKAVEKAIAANLVSSCHDCSDGGVGVALAETAFAGGLGMEVDLEKVPRAKEVSRNDFLLFSETPSRFVATVSQDRKKDFEKMMEGNAFACVGSVNKSGNFVVKGLNGRIVVNAPVRELKDAWQKTLKW